MELPEDVFNLWRNSGYFWRRELGRLRSAVAKYAAEE